jgi:hypothetical protein
MQSSRGIYACDPGFMQGYAIFTHNLRSSYAIVTQSLRRIYACDPGLTQDYAIFTQYLRIKYAAYTQLSRSRYAVFAQFLCM